ncbi:MAG: beta-ketoacyl-[acyl-carrier-protein] synthase II, partial [Acidobacteria bacterium]|nr:beta-ketoacyl-[acyl-carrier-protein] synthase II [Acidobacteriota bacterium]
GESLGAGGAFQAAALVAALLAGRVPALPGLDGAAPAVDLDTGGRRGQLRRGLVTGLGLDGNACALALETPATS